MVGLERWLKWTWKKVREKGEVGAVGEVGGLGEVREVGEVGGGESWERRVNESMDGCCFQQIQLHNL